jgi:hypothetical protein
MKRRLTVALSVCLTLPLIAQQKEQDRLKESYTVMKEILGTPDKGIPSRSVEQGGMCRGISVGKEGRFCC